MQLTKVLVRLLWMPALVLGVLGMIVWIGPVAIMAIPLGTCAFMGWVFSEDWFQ